MEAEDAEESPGVSEKARGKTEAIVQCDGYRCMARVDAKGCWQDLKGNPLEVVKVVRWIW